MNSKGETVTENDQSTLWKTVFLALVFGALTLVVALSVFFYIRVRESMWDNRAGIPRLVVMNRSSPEKFGSEIFTVFGSEDITLNGLPNTDENCMFLAQGGILVLEIAGVSTLNQDGSLSAYSSRVLVSRKDGESITAMDDSGTSLSATEMELTPATGGSGPVFIRLDGTRVEIRGVSGRKYALKIQATGWYP